MSDANLLAPMPRVYDMRVLRLAPLWMWSEADLYLLAPTLHGVFLRGDWTNDSAKRLWGLSFGARTVYSSRSLGDARLARDEWSAMIKAARLLAGVDRA